MGSKLDSGMNVLILQVRKMAQTEDDCLGVVSLSSAILMPEDWWEELLLSVTQNKRLAYRANSPGRLALLLLTGSCLLVYF